MSKNYTLEDMYKFKLNKFLNYFELPRDSNAEISENFAKLDYTDKLKLFKEYLIKYFHYFYDHNICNLYEHQGDCGSFFSELSVPVNVPNCKRRVDFVLTIEFFEEDEDGPRMISDLSLWAENTDFSGKRSIIGFKIEEENNMLRDVSDDLLNILKEVYENISQNVELVAWYILNGVDLKRLLLQDEVNYHELFRKDR